MFGPVNKRKDGTFVFASPVGSGHVPMIALSDLGFWARYTFDNRTLTSGRELEVASELVGWDDLVRTFTRVTGFPAVVVPQTLDAWFANFTGVDDPVANEKRIGDADSEKERHTTWRTNFSGWWALYRDDLIKRDMKWIRSVNPGGHTLESWMREKKYDGQWKVDVLKNSEDGKSIMPKWDVLEKL